MMKHYGMAVLISAALVANASAQKRPSFEKLERQAVTRSDIRQVVERAPVLDAQQYIAQKDRLSEAPIAPIIKSETRSEYSSRYIVVLDDKQLRTNNADKLNEESVRQIALDILNRQSIRVQRDDLTVLSGALNGFVIETDQQQLNQIARDPRILFIEQDSQITTQGVQQNPPSWGLDRIDQRNLPLNQSFAYDGYTGSMHAYVIDTGVRPTHSEFRRTDGSTRAVSAFNSVGGTPDDCNGHGTHVAGTMAGKTYGVARSASVYGVKVLSCNGSGSTSGVIAGVNWVATNFQSPGVANMSLGGGLSPSLNLAVDNAIASGVPIVVAAGNSNQNAANFSPASVQAAITVGSTDTNDRRSSYSNWGDVVDVFAPGRGIKSSWHTSDTATNTIPGTSMAAPHVAGIALILAARDGNKDPSNIAFRIVQQATTGVVTDPKGPNRLAYHYPSLVEAGLIGCRNEQVPSKYGPLDVVVFCADDTIPVEIESQMSDGYFVGLAEFDTMSWSDVTSHHSSWVCSNCTVPSVIAANDFISGNFTPGKVYALKVAVGPVWDSETVFFKIDPAC